MFKGFKTGFWLGVLLVLILSTSAGAAPTPMGKSELSTTAPAEPESRSVYLSAALNQGTSSLSNPVPGSTVTSGSRTEVLLVATADLGRFVIEAGGGWLHDSISGQANPQG